MLDKMQEARKFLQDHSYDESNAWIGLIYKKKDGSYVGRSIGSGPCHGALSSYSFPGHVQRLRHNTSEELVAVWSRLFKRHVPDKYASLYYEWLFNESCWADVFLTKSYEDVKNFGVVVDVNKPNLQVISAFIAFRFLTEVYNRDWKDRCKVFVDLIDEGVSVGDAFFFFHLLALQKKGGYIFSRMSSGHAVFEFANDSKGYYKNALNNTPKFGGRENFYVSAKVCGYHNGVYQLWNGTDKVKNFHQQLSSIRPKSQIKGVDHHIFRPVAKDVYIIEKRYLKEVVDQMKEVINA